jgi:peroxiredoxin
MIKISGFVVLMLSLSMIGCATSQPDARAGLGSKSRMMRNFTLPDLKGRRVQLRELTGKVVYLTFWASWCDPCVLELPLLQKMWERHRSKGFELVTINVDGPEKESAVRHLARRYRFRFPVLLDQETEVVSRFNPKLDLPYALLIDRDGRVVSVHQGYHTGDEGIIEEEIVRLLGR